MEVGNPSGGVAELFRNPHLRRVFIVNALLAVAWDLHSFFIPIYGAMIGLSALLFVLMLHWTVRTSLGLATQVGEVIS